MAAAGPDEILVSDLTRALTGAGWARFRGSRDAHVQGARRRVAPRGVRSGAMADLPLILAVDEDAEALERITGELQRYERDYSVICGPSTDAALAQLEALHEQRRGRRDRARRTRNGSTEGRGAARARPRPASAREARAPHPVGRVGGRGDGERDSQRDGARPHRLLRAEAVQHAGRAVPSPDLGVPRGVATPERPGTTRAHRRRGPALGARLRAAEPARAQRRAACVPHARVRGGEGVPRRLRPAGGGRSGRGPRGRNAARGSGARGPRAVRDAHAHRDRPHWTPVRRRDRRRRPGRPCRRGLRLVGRARCARRRA